ncbi:MAG: XTP/dITP diphosphatase [Lactobacillaceae bacterium]|jgi:XTP/dITP diphosphohydrolase|nr:XTP/dITP diphosphatase [Lactobacillaceae bacterium]
MPKLIFATNNAGKVREFKKFLDPLGIDVVTLAELQNVPPIIENGTTFLENATIKAETIAKAFNLPVVAEDSGLTISALNDEPGVLSARYAADHDDAANNAKVLAKMIDVPDDQRQAAFHTVIVALKPTGEKLVTTGQVDGLIMRDLKGENGFGYDPLFFYPPYNKRTAEMTTEEKNEISHRGQALRAFMAQFDAWWN